MDYRIEDRNLWKYIITIFIDVIMKDIKKDVKNCLLCGAKSSLPYYDFGAPDKIKVYNRICTNCGLVFQSPRQAYDALKDYYQKYTQTTQPELANIPIGFENHILAIAQLRFEFLKPFLKDRMRVLDIGCSFGAMLKVLRDESSINLKLVGVNPEASFAIFGKEKYGLDIRIGMFEEQNFEPESFDLIILDNVIEHFDYPKECLKNIHTLLSTNGKIFIVTNNLDTPHGFLWQNFFIDHTVTFSPKTLTALLKIEGFKIIKQEFSGHITYEGYHYPYQCCLAVKTKVPSNYDFRLNGERSDDKIREAKDYIKQYIKKDGFIKRLAKRFYELKLIKNPGYFLRVKIKIFEILGKMAGKEMQFQISNHTLPPEKYFCRYVIVIICQTDADILLATQICQKSGLNQFVMILLKINGENFKVHFCSPGLFKKDPPSKFKSIRMFWEWLLFNSLRIGVGINLQLYNVDLPEDILLRTSQKFHWSEKKYALVDFRQFTPAIIEFFRGETLTNIPNMNSYDITLHQIFNEDDKIDKSSMFIWPSREDYFYYYKDKFTKYFKYPNSISLDLSPECNKRCYKCQFHSHLSPYANKIKRDEVMPKEFVFKILDEVSQWNTKPTIATSFSGEPLIYPYLFDMLEYSKRLGLNIQMTTNGIVLTKEIAQHLINLKVDSIVFSLDTLDESTYNLLQPPGSVSVVTKNILNLLELRGSNKKPFVGIHFTMEERNKEQFEEFINFWGNKVDSVSRAIMQNQFKACLCVLPLWFSIGHKQACWSAWTNMYIRWNGDISYCGFDIDGKISGLNINNRSLLDTWNSDEFWHWRNAQLNNDHSILYCKACPDWAGLRNFIIKKNNWQIQRASFIESYIKIN